MEDRRIGERKVRKSAGETEENELQERRGEREGRKRYRKKEVKKID